MLKLEEQLKEAKTKHPSERITKAKRLRTLAKGYKALKKDKATAYQAAAEALELCRGTRAEGGNKGKIARA